MRLRLGGPEWPDRALRLQAEDSAGEEYRGARVVRSHLWVGWCEDQPVGLLGGDVYDCWASWDGSDAEHPVVLGREDGPAMGSAYVVDPLLWRQGYGAALLRAGVSSPEVSDVRVFALGIDADNIASIRCAEAVGFAVESTEPDWEDIVHHVRRR